MEIGLTYGYLLYVNGRAAQVGKTLQEAQAAAVEYFSHKALLQIKSAVAPASTQAWNYDYGIQQWVELVRG